MSLEIFHPTLLPGAVSGGLLILRVLLGLGLLTHGLYKLNHFSEVSQNFPAPFGLSKKMSVFGAIVGEVFLNLLVIIGLFGQLAAIGVALMFLMIYFVVHGGAKFADRELAYLYGIGYILLAITGPGAYSLDALSF